MAVIYATFAVAKRKPEKTSGLYGIRTLDLCDAGAALYQLSYQTNWEQVVELVGYKPVKGWWCCVMNIWKSYMWTAELVKNYMNEDHRSYIYMCSCQKKACKEFRLVRNSTLDFWVLVFSPFMTWRIFELIHWSWYINTYIYYSFFKYTFSANYWLRKVFFKFKFYLVIYSFIFFSTDCKDQFSRCRFYKRYCSRSSYIRSLCKKTCQLCKK